MNRSSTPSPIERMGNALAFLLVFGILAFGGYFIYNIIFGEGDFISLGGADVVRPTEVVVVELPTLTPFAGGGNTVPPPSSPTALFQQPTAAPPTATNTPIPSNTPLPTSEPSPTVSPTSPIPPTPSEPSPTSFPTSTVPPTGTPLPPPTPVPQFLFRVGSVGPDYSRGCPGYYVFGYVRDSGGNPLPGLRIRVVSEFGYEIPPATTKTDPPGGYDVLISQQRSLWYVTVVDAANTPLSPAVEVLNTGNFVEGSEACWHQVDFVRVN